MLSLVSFMKFPLGPYILQNLEQPMIGCFNLPTPHCHFSILVIVLNIGRPIITHAIISLSLLLSIADIATHRQKNNELFGFQCKPSINTHWPHESTIPQCTVVIMLLVFCCKLQVRKFLSAQQLWNFLSLCARGVSFLRSCLPSSESSDRHNPTRHLSFTSTGGGGG